MRIRHLHYFLIVAEEQSFARVATRVHIEASPLSRAISELESQLGVKLFGRTKGSIKLTWPGEAFRDEAWPILSFVEMPKLAFISLRKASAVVFGWALRRGSLNRVSLPTNAWICSRSDRGTTFTTESAISCLSFCPPVVVY
ncbi:LysR family transcriptional regulator [Pseudomonas aeruginosa]|uniref:helix-turn-helix domain-containing protein n=1 Tax=Pseudomonas aeruginosa TaxID=287 RepID=UPI001E471532|nr:LysR family transcriptional regulator [Pseudomonas aeruginosa]MCS8097295.1 LysR family transcriptional regulator [Pseudomonas aeruginosa]